MINAISCCISSLLVWTVRWLHRHVEAQHIAGDRCEKHGIEWKWIKKNIWTFRKCEAGLTCDKDPRLELHGTRPPRSSRLSGAEVFTKATPIPGSSCKQHFQLQPAYCGRTLNQCTRAGIDICLPLHHPSPLSVRYQIVIYIFFLFSPATVHLINNTTTWLVVCWGSADDSARSCWHVLTEAKRGKVMCVHKAIK